MNRTVFKNVNVATPRELRKHCNVLVEGSRIEDISSDFEKLTSRVKGQEYSVLEYGGKYLVPGFIDIHTHGGAGVSAYNRNLQPWIEYKARNGVTSFIPTLLTMPLEDMYRALKNLVGVIERGSAMSRVIGINMEGPYLSPKYGSQRPEMCITPRKNDYRKFFDYSKNYLKIMTIAPELQGAEKLIRELRDRNVIVAIGHTDAGARETERAVELGANLITHSFDAFRVSGLKEPGVREVTAMEVLLARDEVYSELICDRESVHVDPVLIQILLKCKSIDKIILITDSMSATGMPDGKYERADGIEFEISFERSDLIRLGKERIIGGLLYKLKDAVRNLMKHTGVSFLEALKTVTINPARLLGIDDRFGSIQIGKMADLAVIDGDFNVYLTMVNGRVVFKK